MKIATRHTVSHRVQIQPIMKPAAALLACLLLVPVASAQQPDAELIMKGARMSASLVKLDKGLTGQLRQGFRKVPVTMFLQGGDIQFQFTEDKQKTQIFHMRLGDNACQLFEIKDNKSSVFPPAKLVTPIAKTDLTYEDLSLRFLYWPAPKWEQSDNVSGQPCHKIRIDRPKGAPGNYEVVYVWVHEKFGAFMRIRGHDKNGALIKEFQVEDVMQIAKDTWTLRKMQVSTHNPATGRRSSLTDVSFDTPNQRGPRGLR